MKKQTSGDVVASVNSEPISLVTTQEFVADCMASGKLAQNMEAKVTENLGIEIMQVAGKFNLEGEVDAEFISPSETKNMQAARLNTMEGGVGDQLTPPDWNSKHGSYQNK
ncbi:hypothetical protein ACH5RR_041098 [Cinchona calisaya]|uniref:Uncharacterized protein n=1 Tax=Cinchona calisaya TaxID=153742 RepID=A0ABD2XSY9_9GENT